MATASSSQGCFERRRRDEKGGEGRRGFPFPRQTCGVVAELSRGHAAHIACSHPAIPPHPSPLLSTPSLPHSPPLTCQFLSQPPLANKVINLSVCLLHWQNQWAVLGCVDTAAVKRGCGHLTETYCYISTNGRLRWRPFLIYFFYDFVTTFDGATPRGRLQCTANEKMHP